MKFEFEMEALFVDNATGLLTAFSVLLIEILLA